MKIAHTIHIDAAAEKVYIEGVEFDYYLEETPSIDIVFEGNLARVTMSVFADNVTFGEQVIHSTMDLPKADRAKVESAWAKRESKRIVHEGMAEVLKWLSSAAVEQMDGIPQRYMAGLPNGSQTTMIHDTNH